MIHEKAMELVAALRSGKYKQTTDRTLRREDDFCCLGVACDISGLGTWAVSQDLTDRYQYDVDKSAQAGTAAQVSVLPKMVQDYFGLKSNNGLFGLSEGLSGMNDRGSTFEDIADFIEKNWEQL